MPTSLRSHSSLWLALVALGVACDHQNQPAASPDGSAGTTDPAKIAPDPSTNGYGHGIPSSGGTDPSPEDNAPRAGGGGAAPSAGP